MMEIIPALDIIEGKCVRLTGGDYTKITVYHNDPLEVAMKFEDAGLKRLHLVDLDGARMGEVKNWKVLERIAGKTGLRIDFGGGIKKLEDVQIVFNSGAQIVTVGSIAVKNEIEFINWLERFGPSKFMLGADVKDERIAVSGWKEETTVSIYDLLEKYVQHKLEKVFCTDISKDGRLEGPSIDLYRKIIEQYQQLYFIASGGIRSMKDLEDLAGIGCCGAIIGKAIYEERISLKELSAFNVN